MDTNLEKEKLLMVIKKYFDVKIKENKMTKIDNKLLNVIDPKIKHLLDKIE